jgi:integrase
MASFRFHGNRWQARVRRKGYADQTKSFLTRQDAERWARSIEVEFDRSTFIDQSAAQTTTFGELIQRYIKEVLPFMRGAHADSIRLNAILRRSICKTLMHMLTPSKIATYRDERLRQVSSGTVIRELAYFSSVINHARREWNINTPNPVQLVKKPPSPPGRNRILSKEEEVTLLHAAEPIANRNIYTRPFVILALETAMRRGELLSLHWCNIDLQRRTAFLKMTKNGESRCVPLSMRAIETLQLLPKNIDSRVFPINFAALETNFKRATRRAGISNLRIHDLRHTATTRLAEKLSNVLELSAVTGHKQLNMLKRYYHPNPELLALKLN